MAFFVVPLNALLQHRGHLLIGAGHSIAVQNFNENLGILLLSGAYTLMVKANLHIKSYRRDFWPICDYFYEPD